MAIPRESFSSERIIKYTRYHRAALLADPQAEHLAAAIDMNLGNLRAKAKASDDAEEDLIEARALNDRAEFDLDRECRLCELDVLKAVRKDRQNPAYIAAFPNGLSAMVAARGETQARQVATLIAALKKDLPDLATAHAETLEFVADRAVSAERAVTQAEDAVGRAFTDELLARGALVRQLHANRGGLRALYPRDAARVRSYFQNTRRRSEPDSDEVAEELDEGQGEE